MEYQPTLPGIDELVERARQEALGQRALFSLNLEEEDV